MGDAHPLVLELFADLQTVAKLLGQIRHINRVEFFGRFVLENGGVGCLLKKDEVGLAHDCGVDVVHRAGQKVPPHSRVFLLGQQFVGHYHFRKDRSGLGQGQGGVLGQHRVMLGHH